MCGRTQELGFGHLTALNGRLRKALFDASVNEERAANLAAQVAQEKVCASVGF
jgi:hypothetical protein